MATKTEGGKPPAKGKPTPIHPPVPTQGGNPPTSGKPPVPVNPPQPRGQGNDTYQGPAVGTTVYIPWSFSTGEDINKLAAQFGVSVSQIYNANPGVTFANGNQIQIPWLVTSQISWQQLGEKAGISGAHLQLYQSQIPKNPTTSNPITPTEASELNSLQGANRDAYAALMDLFNSYGLSSLAPNIFNYVQQGYSSDTISILLQSTPEYQQRFAGNALRVKNGLSVLTPAEYLSTEASYRQIVQSAGLPANFYNSTSDWTGWIGNDVSPTEVQARVSMAQQATQAAPPALIQALNVMGVPTSSIVAYYLDDSKALPILQQQFNAAQIGASALRNGLAMDAGRATTFANMGISVNQANQAYQQIGQTLPTLEMLGQVYNQAYSQTTAENDLLMGNGQAALQTQKLVGQEKAAFSGNSAVNQQSLGTAPPPTGAGKY